MRCSLFAFVLLTSFAPALSQGLRPAENMMRDLVVGRKHEPCWVISNVPEDQAMPAVCRGTLREPVMSKKLKYIPLSSEFGKFGRNKKDLLPFNWRKENELVIAVDTSRLTSAERDSLDRLLGEIFPGLEKAPPYPHVHIRAQASGRREYQVYASAPNFEYLNKALDKLYSIPAERLPPVNPPLEEVHRIWKLAVLTNCADAAGSFAESLEFADFQQFNLSEASSFQGAGADIHAVLLNWNGDEEVQPEAAASLLPEKFKAKCTRTQSESPLGRSV
ncbi:MAG: hypothetical protein ACP5R4_14100, partial [Armatimonadota bacterium]